jgi:hypothetical protein
MVAALACLSAGWAPVQERSAIPVKSPIVLLVGCASTTSEPHIWVLAHAGTRTPSSTPGIPIADRSELLKRSLGRDLYHLIGVADFVDGDTARKIGVRGQIFPRARVNATGALASGHKVAVKGLYIDATPPRVNLTSVVDLGDRCP